MYILTSNLSHGNNYNMHVKIFIKNFKVIKLLKIINFLSWHCNYFKLGKSNWSPNFKGLLNK